MNQRLTIDKVRLLMIFAAHLCTLALCSQTSASGVRAVALDRLISIFVGGTEIHISSVYEFGAPAIDNADRVAFYSIGLNYAGVYYGNERSLARVPISPSGGASRLQLNLNRSGNGQLVLLPSNGIASYSDGVATVLAEHGAVPPGVSSDFTYLAPGMLTGAVVNPSGTVLFSSEISGPSGFYGSGIWGGSPNDIRPVAVPAAAAGDASVPSLPQVLPFPSNFSPISLTSKGDTSFLAANDDGSVESLWIAGAEGLRRVVQTGDPVSGIAGASFHSFLGANPAMSSDWLLFAATITGDGVTDANNSTIWLYDGDQLSLLGRSGQPAPGLGGITFTGFASGEFGDLAPALSAGGQAAFWAGLDDNSSALIVGDDQGFRLVARIGEVLPGVEDTWVLSNPVELHLNAPGQLAFYAYVREPPLFNYRDGIWATDRVGSLHKIVADGDMLEVAPGDFREVTAIAYREFSSGGDDGRASMINDSGQIVFTAQFADHTYGVFISDAVAVPEPASWLLVLVAVAGLAIRRRSAARSQCGAFLAIPTPRTCSRGNKWVNRIAQNGEIALMRTASRWLLALFVLAAPNLARADIYQWEYIDPGNPGLGKRQSSTLAPDGAGVDAVPFAGLSSLDLTMAYLIGAKLNEADFTNATLTDADFTGTEVRGADFFGTTSGGFTAAQLYSTASYQAGDLSGIGLGGFNDLTGWNFAGLDLTDADFGLATLIGADFTGSEVRGADFSFTTYGGFTPGGFTAAHLYATASYQARDLSGVSLWGNDLTGWNFTGQDLTNARFRGATLTDADFTNAVVRGVDFADTTFQSFTAAQLYSTASYQAGDLSGIDLSSSTDLTGWNFAGQNLTSARLIGARLTNADLSYANLTNVQFNGATLTGANLTGAEIRGADFAGGTSRGFTAAQLYSTTSYQARDLAGVRFDNSGFPSDNYTDWNFAGQNLTNANFSPAVLTGANLSQANLTNANFNGATLSGADFSGAEVRGASFAATTSHGFTAAQLYSTASYQTGNLTGVDFRSDNLTGWNFAGQNLTNAKFDGAALTDANFAEADTRGAQFLALSGAITTNVIRPDGSIHGLDLTAGRILVIRDYDGGTDVLFPNGPISIFIEQHLALDATGTLQMLFEADDWDSLISFAPGIPVSLGGGVLELGFAADVDIASQVGRTFHLFDWTGVISSGAFNVVSNYQWDFSRLYITGEVTLVAIPEPNSLFLTAVATAGLVLRRRRLRTLNSTATAGNDYFPVNAVLTVNLVANAVPGDYNRNGTVDAADYTVWRDTLGSTADPRADGTGDDLAGTPDGDVDQWDYDFWKANFGNTLNTGSGSNQTAPAGVPEPASWFLIVVAAGCLARRFKRV